jgi:TolB-like protein
MDRLGPAIAGEQAGKVAVAMFYAARGFDAYALSDLQNDLFVAAGQSGSVAGKYSGRPMIGEPLSDKDRDELKKLGATSVVLGSVSLRTEGYIVNAALVNVASGAILTTATARQ